MRKALVIVFIVLGMVCIAVGVRSLKSHSSSYTPQTFEETAEQPAEESHKENSTSGNPTNGFEDLESLVRYDLHSEIASKLDAESFDRALVSYLKNEGLVPDTYGIGIILVKDDGWVTTNLDDGSFMFNLQLQTQDREIVTCTVSNGEYAFDVSGTKLEPEEEEEPEDAV